MPRRRYSREGFRALLTMADLIIATGRRPTDYELAIDVRTGVVVGIAFTIEAGPLGPAWTPTDRETTDDERDDR